MKNFLIFGSSPSAAVSSCMLMLLRLFVAAMMLTHGMAKLISFGQMQNVFPDPIGIGPAASLVLAILAEVGCSLLIAVGLFTRLATGVLIINMSVAAFIAHAGDPFATRELAIFYLGLYIYIFFTGAGPISADNLFFSVNKKR